MDNTKKIAIIANYVISNIVTTYNRYFIVICNISNQKQSKELYIHCKYLSGIGHLKKNLSSGLLSFAESHSSTSFDFRCNNEKKMLYRIEKHIDDYILGYHDKVSIRYIRFL